MTIYLFTVPTFLRMCLRPEMKKEKLCVWPFASVTSSFSPRSLWGESGTYGNECYYKLCITRCNPWILSGWLLFSLILLPPLTPSVPSPPLPGSSEFHHQWCGAGRLFRAVGRAAVSSTAGTPNWLPRGSAVAAERDGYSSDMPRRSEAHGGPRLKPSQHKQHKWIRKWMK